ncbi:hypothetical protein Lalb_Chr02g0157261 [Lupinus albus]|uniref:Uncharacterized protein n=1 Tax=Lupinus albus TaxID=3870 RepID=A0A6A4R350_LUPAL|nr:hypothetical protein Lalb_Chr02g0157261 [Lupinus albus]
MTFMSPIQSFCHWVHFLDIIIVDFDEEMTLAATFHKFLESGDPQFLICVLLQHYVSVFLLLLCAKYKFCSYHLSFYIFIHFTCSGS